MDSKGGFEMSLIVVEAIRGRCTSFLILKATVSEIFGGYQQQVKVAIRYSVSCIFHTGYYTTYYNYSIQEVYRSVYSRLPSL